VKGEVMKAAGAMIGNETAAGARARVRTIVKGSPPCSARVAAAEFASIPLFAQVPEGHLQRVANAASLRRLRPRAMVIQEHAECRTLNVLLEGLVEIFSRLDDRESVIDVAEPGAALLLASVMAGLPYAASARTLSPACILAIPVTAVRKLFEDDRSFAKSVAYELSRSTYGMLAELKIIKMYNSSARLAEWLLRADNRSDDRGPFRLPFSKHTLASRLGMTPESLSRGLRSLADHGVRVRGRTVMVENRAALTAIVGPAASAPDTDL
jgi:CRP/FNR family transcriptional activator FtrB